MISVKFEKFSEVPHLDDLFHSRPLSPPEGKDWTRYELVELAGVLKLALHICLAKTSTIAFTPKKLQKAPSKRCGTRRRGLKFPVT